MRSIFEYLIFFKTKSENVLISNLIKNIYKKKLVKYSSIVIKEPFSNWERLKEGMDSKQLFKTVPIQTIIMVSKQEISFLDNYRENPKLITAFHFKLFSSFIVLAFHFYVTYSHFLRLCRGSLQKRGLIFTRGR